MHSPSLKCKRTFTPPNEEAERTCGHRYDEHATDLNHTEEHCWHGAVTGDCCQCPGFLA